MEELGKKIQYYADQYARIMSDKKYKEERELPGDMYFIERDEILAIPRDDGDSRYPYGEDGFNFWAYASGYMHCNEGIFVPFLRVAEGKEPNIAFFANIGQGLKKETISLLSIPMLETVSQVSHYSIFTKSCVYYITETAHMRFVIRLFIDGDNRMIFTIMTENLTTQAQDISLSSFLNPFLAHSLTEVGDHRWFREVCYYEGKSQLGYFLVKGNEDLTRTKSISNYGVIKRRIQCGKKSSMRSHEETTSRYQYVGGSRGSLHLPLGVKENTFSNPKHVTTFTEMGAAGDLIHLNIGAQDAVRLDITLDYLTYCQDEIELTKLINQEMDIAEIDLSLFKLENAEKVKDEGLKLSAYGSKDDLIKEQVFNSFIVHLKKQVEFCALMKGYVQAYVGSLIGIRDIFQALEGLLVWEPEATRKKILEALDFTGPDGRCPRQYSLLANKEIGPEMDLRPFIDQGVWVISTLVTYLKTTGDFSILEEMCGYYEIIDEKRNQVQKMSKKDSVLSHMFKIMDYLLSNRDFEKTKCIRALYGDWNDALDGLGVSLDPDKDYGSGGSVMTSLQVYQNLMEMEELLHLLDGQKYLTKIETFKLARKEIKEGLEKYAVVTNEDGQKRIVHGWGDQLSYYVGSFEDPDNQSRYGLTSNAFWVLTGLYEEDMSMKPVILDAFSNLDSKYGLKTFNPHFEPYTKGVGRIPKLPPGTAENGAAYIHGSMFGIEALFAMGESQQAWEQLTKSLPFTHAYISNSSFVMPNSYSFNEEKNLDGESMADWQTGSSNVLLKLLIKYVYGLNPQYHGVWIQPASYMPFDQIDLAVNIKGCELSINYKMGGEGKRRFLVNGSERAPEFDQVMNIDKLWLSNEELSSHPMTVEVIN